MDEIIVEIPGIGEVAFPASMSRDEIKSQVFRLSSQQPGMAYGSSGPVSFSYPVESAVRPSAVEEQKSLWEDATRQMGLTARGAVTGITGLPAMAGDTLNMLINQIAGTDIPPASQSMQNLMTRAGLPEPQTGTERVSQDVVAGMTGVGAAPAISRGLNRAGQELMEPLLRQLGTQTVASGTAAGAAGATREMGGGTGAQMATGLTAGMITPGATGALRSGRNAIRPLAEPFTMSGQERMAGNLLRQQSTDPMAAIKRMEQSVPQIPGSQPTMAATAGDYGLASLERTASQLPEATGQYAQRMAQNNLARNVLVEKYAADKALSDAIMKRDDITSGIREKAFAQKSPVKPDAVIRKIDNILQSEVGSRQLVKEQLNAFKRQLQSEINETGFSDPARLYSVRKDINDIIEGNTVGSRAENTKKVASSQLIDVRNTLDQIIESGAPEYQEYLRMYRTMSRPIDQIKTMQNISTKASGGTVDPQTGVRTFTPVRFGKLVEQLKKDRRNPLSKTQMSVLEKVAKELDEGASINLPGVKPAGSDTFKNLTVANLLGNVSANPVGQGLAANLIETFARPISWVYRGGEDAVRQLIVDAILDPKLAAQLMRKATPQNIEQTSRSLLEKASQMGYGSAFGVAVTQ